MYVAFISLLLVLYQRIVVQRLAATALSQNILKLSLLKQTANQMTEGFGKRVAGLRGNLDAKTQPPKQVKCVHDRLNGQYKPTACV